MKTVLIDEAETVITPEVVTTEEKKSNTELIVAIVIIVLAIAAFAIYNYIQGKQDGDGQQSK